MMNVAERKQATAPADAQRWLESFDAALQAQDTTAAAELFLPDGLWRDVLAFTWTIETMSGRAAIAATLRETLARKMMACFSLCNPVQAGCVSILRSRVNRRSRNGTRAHGKLCR